MLKKVAGLLLAITIGLSSGWILRGQEAGSMAVVYYWKAKAGKLDDYNRYIQTVAEPVDADARRTGAFVSVTTYVSHKPESPWTHMRIFILKDREQAANLAKALGSAHPARRKQAQSKSGARGVTSRQRGGRRTRHSQVAADDSSHSAYFQSRIGHRTALAAVLN